MSKLICKNYDIFNVYNMVDNFTFYFLSCNDVPDFWEGLTDFVLQEDNLLNYANRISKNSFIPTIRNYTTLLRNLEIFLNEKLDTLKINQETDEIIDILGQEYTFLDKDNLILQNDKVGKIGEYIFHVLLTNFFQCDCIVPKFKCITDRNMSVFGIDALFINAADNTLLFGESKVCKNIENGMRLVNRSLSDYENQIKEEYRLVLSNDDSFIKSAQFRDLFQEYIEVCISIEQFIAIGGIKKIGVPIFIAHGHDTKYDGTPEYYLNKMKNGINRCKYFGLNTYYIAISLPIVCKDKFFDILMKKIIRKKEYYERLQSA